MAGLRPVREQLSAPRPSEAAVQPCNTACADNPPIVWLTLIRGLRLTRVRGVPLAGEALHNFSLINKHNRPDDHTVTLVDIEWHAHEEHVLLAEQSLDVE